VNELEQLLQQKVGLSPEQAQMVIQVVASHLESRIPAPLQSMVAPLLGLQSGAADGQSADAGQSGGLGSLLGSVESMFGSKG
jgi:hypothetical protein